MRPLLREAAFLSAPFAKSRIEKLEAKKLGATGLQPLPPHADDLLLFERGLKNSPERPAEKIRRPEKSPGGRGFSPNAWFYDFRLFTGSVGSLLVQAQQWVGPVTPRYFEL